MMYNAKDIMGWNEETRPEEQRFKLFANARARTVEIARENRNSIPTVLGSVCAIVWRWAAAGVEGHERDAVEIKALADECD